MPKQTVSHRIGKIFDRVSYIKNDLAYLKVNPDWQFDQATLNMIDSIIEFLMNAVVFLYKNAVKKVKNKMDPDRYIFVYSSFSDNVLFAVYWDKVNKVFTPAGINVTNLEFMGGFDSGDAAEADIVRTLKGV